MATKTAEKEQPTKKAFLPQGYELPKPPSQFMKLEEDKTVRFRLMCEPTMGWLVFGSDKKPHRKPENDPFTPEELAQIQEGLEKKEAPKHFWATIVYDNESKGFKVLEITQTSIKKKIMEFMNDEDFGNPYGYDIKITRKGQGLKTEYICNPAPPSELPKEVLDTFEGLHYDLDKLFEGKYPLGDD
jgi:hypothetical protein